MAREVDGVGFAINVLFDAATGADGAAAFFLFFFVLAAAEGTMGGRAGGTMMTSILLEGEYPSRTSHPNS